MMNVHIAPSGSVGPIEDAIKYFKIDKLYIITSEEKKRDFEKIKQMPIEILVTDAFDFQAIVDSITGIYSKEKDEKIYINITGGTNVMSVASHVSAMFLGLECYYMPINQGPIYPGVPTLFKNLKDEDIQLIKNSSSKGTLYYNRSKARRVNKLKRLGIFEIKSKQDKHGRKINYAEPTPIGKFFLEIIKKSNI
ncbi:MAG: hypothetical protein HPY60_00340 [Candidatus Methanofastidiosum sp.]|nr:hypothetical protein [Methanofastidiosum sp.]